MTKDKKPDYVVYDEATESYNAKLLPYSSSVSAPKITPPNVSSWKNGHIIGANQQFNAKFNAIKAEYEQLMEAFNYNDLVYSASFSFEPIVGETYFLYEGKKGGLFLSLIPPHQCTFNYQGTFTLGPDKMWIKEKNTEETK